MSCIAITTARIPEMSRAWINSSRWVGKHIEEAARIEVDPHALGLRSEPVRRVLVAHLLEDGERPLEPEAFNASIRRARRDRPRTKRRARRLTGAFIRASKPH